MSSRLRAERPADALAGTKVVVLGHLNRYGPSSAGRIAASANLQPQSLTRAFNELQLAGLISRSQDPHDRRAAVLTLTETGRQALVRDMSARDVWLENALDCLTEAEAEVLRIAAGLMERLAEPMPASVATTGEEPEISSPAA